ncbi:MAG: hypothetical protein WC067_00505 [Candidatus Methanomethylophilaceae archaeon]
MANMDELFVDVSGADLTLSEILRLVERIQSDNPDMDIFLDGDRQAIMGRPHVVQNALER